MGRPDDHDAEPPDAGADAAADAVAEVFAVQPVWMIAATVVTVRPYGDRGRETRRGLRLFAAGATVHVVAGHHGMGLDDVTVVGRHRASKRYITVDVRSRHLLQWRLELVRSPHLIRQVIDRSEGWYLPADPPDAGSDRLTRLPETVGEHASRREIDQLIERFNRRRVLATLLNGPSDGDELDLGPGTPPEVLMRRRRWRLTRAVRYTLRSWDAERAFYDHERE